MLNPFEVILERLETLAEKINSAPGNSAAHQIEIIDRAELCKRLNITPHTVIKLEKKGKIPAVRAGNVIRYNWPAVVAALSS